MDYRVPKIALEDVNEAVDIELALAIQQLQLFALKGASFYGSG